VKTALAFLACLIIASNAAACRSEIVSIRIDGVPLRSEDLVGSLSEPSACRPPVEFHRDCGDRKVFISRGLGPEGTPQVLSANSLSSLQQALDRAGCACGMVHVLVADGSSSAPVTRTVTRVEEPSKLPGVTRLRGNTPNPFNPVTTIFFDVAEKARVDMRIFDVRGRLVRQLLSAEREPGSHTIVWDGKTTAGQPLASSVYFLHMQAGSVSMSRRLILLR